MEKDTRKIELSDTAEGMVSDDYKTRFIAEYTQLCIRINKLKNFVGRIKYSKYAGIEEPKHDCPVDILERQLKVMHLYRIVLESRAELFENIDLPKLIED